MSAKFEQCVAEFSHTLTAQTPPGEDDFIKQIKPSSRITPERSIEIYRNNTRGARINALEVIYPVCKKILGNDTFRSIGSEYVNFNIYGAADLNRYGETFSIFIKSLLNANRLSHDFAYLADLVRLEYLYHAAYYAADDQTFDFNLFEQRVKSNQPITFQLSASLGLLCSKYPIYGIWLNNNKKNNKADVDAIKTTQYFLVYRRNNKPLITAINAHIYQLLKAFGEKKTLQYAVENIDCNIDIVLPELITQQWIIGIRCKE